MIASAEVEGSTEMSEPVGVLGGRGDTDIDIARARRDSIAGLELLHAFSARTENIQVHPQWGVLLSRLWVQ